MEIYFAPDRRAPLVEQNVAKLRGNYHTTAGIAETAYTAATLPFPETVQLFEQYSNALRKFQLAFIKRIMSAKQLLDGTFHPMVWVESQRYALS